MKVSEFHWIKSIDTNEWCFHYYRDDNDRVWERGKKVTGFLSVMAPHRIDGYCKRGHEEEWKRKSIEEYKNTLKESIVFINKTINSLPSEINF